jgi:hypothetical protein
MLSRALLALAALCALQDAEPSRPAPRACHAAAATDAGTAVWGGARACGVDLLDDAQLWLWDGAAWSARPGPPIAPREDALLVSTGAGLALTLLGGRRDGVAHADVWTFDGEAWTERPAEGGPGAIQHGAAAFDPVRRRLVVFGGAVGQQPGGRTHEWDGARWHDVDASGPAARVGHAMAWSPADGAVLLYGGFAEESFRDLWAWDGTSWKRLAADGPTITEGHVVAGADEGLLLVGGGPEGTAALRVWRWHDGRFEALGEAGPSPRIGATASWDRARRVLVYWGGADALGQPSARVDEFDGARWQLRDPK